MPTRRDQGDYHTARQVGGLLCIVAGVLLGFIDAFSVDYTLDAISFGLLMGTGAILLGAEPILSRLDRS